MRYGAHQYRRTEGSALSPRETEAAAFGYVNRLFLEATDPAARMRALAKNQQLWSLLLRDLGSSTNRLPEPLKSDLVRLGLWSTRTTIAAMGRPDADIAPLVALNGVMIEALRQAPLPAAPMAAATARPDLAAVG